MQWSIQKSVIGKIISVLSQRPGNLQEKAQLEEELKPIFILVEISKDVFCRWSGHWEGAFHARVKAVARVSPC